MTTKAEQPTIPTVPARHQEAKVNVVAAMMKENVLKIESQLMESLFRVSYIEPSSDLLPLLAPLQTPSPVVHLPPVPEELHPILELEPQVFALPHGFTLTATAGILPEGHLGKEEPATPTCWSVGLELYWTAVDRVVWAELKDFVDCDGARSGDQVREHIRATVERFTGALGG